MVGIAAGRRDGEVRGRVIPDHVEPPEDVALRILEAQRVVGERGVVDGEAELDGVAGDEALDGRHRGRRPEGGGRSRRWTACSPRRTPPSGWPRTARPGRWCRPWPACSVPYPVTAARERPARRRRPRRRRCRRWRASPRPSSVVIALPLPTETVVPCATASGDAPAMARPCCAWISDSADASAASCAVVSVSVGSAGPWSVTEASLPAACAACRPSMPAWMPAAVSVTAMLATWMSAASAAASAAVAPATSSAYGAGDGGERAGVGLQLPVDDGQRRRSRVRQRDGRQAARRGEPLHRVEVARGRCRGVRDRDGCDVAVRREHRGLHARRAGHVDGVAARRHERQRRGVLRLLRGQRQRPAVADCDGAQPARRAERGQLAEVRGDVRGSVHDADGRGRDVVRRVPVGLGGRGARDCRASGRPRSARSRSPKADSWAWLTVRVGIPPSAMTIATSLPDAACRPPRSAWIDAAVSDTVNSTTWASPAIVAACAQAAPATSAVQGPWIRCRMASACWYCVPDSENCVPGSVGWMPVSRPGGRHGGQLRQVLLDVGHAVRDAVRGHPGVALHLRREGRRDGRDGDRSGGRQQGDQARVGAVLRVRQRDRRAVGDRDARDLGAQCLQRVRVGADGGAPCRRRRSATTPGMPRPAPRSASGCRRRRR